MEPKAGARFIIGLLVIGAVVYACWLLLTFFQVMEPFRTIMIIVLLLLALSFVMGWTGSGWGGGPRSPIQ